MLFAHTKRLFIISFLSSALLTGCGGDSSDEMSLSTSVNAINISITENQLPQTIDFTFQALNQTQSLYAGVEYTALGVDLVSYDLSRQPASVSVRFKAPSATGIGTLRDEIYVFLCKDLYCQDHIPGSPKTIPVTYSVEASLESTTSSMSFSRIIGSSESPAAQTVNFSGSGINWSVSTDQAWLSSSLMSGNSAGSVDISITDTSLPSGTYNANLTITNSDEPTEKIQIPVTYFVSTPSISIGTENVYNTITLGGEHGLDFTDHTINISLNTGTNSYPWAITTTTGSWITADTTSGTTNATGSGGININADRSTLGAGSRNDTMQVSVNVNGEIISANVPVYLTTPSHDLLASENGIALTSTPNLSKLTKTIKVNDTYQSNNVPWSASSDQSWLTVTSSGNTGSNLNITADPTGLATDTVHYATVTLNSSEASIQASDNIRVGFWVGSTSVNATDSITASFNQVEVDPVRPYAYVHSGGSSISIYNIYTAALVNTISDVATQLGDMVISSDGNTLYAYDESNASIVPVNLNTLTAGSSWSLSSAPLRKHINIARLKGLDILLASDGRIYNATTGAVLNTRNASTPTLQTFSSNRIIGSSHNGQSFCALNSGFSPYSISCYTLDYNRENATTLLLNPASLESSLASVGSNGQDVALSPDGRYAYVASGAPYNFTVYGLNGAPVGQSLTGAAYPNNMEALPDGTIIAGISNWYGPTDIWVYDAAGTLLSTHIFSGYAKNFFARQLKVSADGLRFISLINLPELQFTTIQ